MDELNLASLKQFFKENYLQVLKSIKIEQFLQVFIAFERDKFIFIHCIINLLVLCFFFKDDTLSFMKSEEELKNALIKVRRMTRL